MNTLNAVTIRSPNEIEEECVKFVVDDTSIPFVFHGVTKENEEYTFSAWLMSDTDVSITVAGIAILLGTEWERQFVTFIADSTDLEIYFNEPGTYYFYNTQLEIGNMMTDWAPAPEDTDESFDEVNNKFKEYVTTLEMNSAIEASASEISASVSAVETTVDGLDSRVETAEAKLELKVDSDTLISEINASADVISLSGNRFVVNSDNLKIAEDGTLTAVNGIFSGQITADTGQIGCFTIENASLVANVDEGFSAILLQSHTEETSDYHNLYLSPKQLQIYSIYSSNSTADRVDKIAFLSGDGLIFNGTGECSKYTYTDCSIAGNLTVKGASVSLDGHTHTTLSDCDFTNSLTLKGVSVSVDGHVHNVLTNSDGTGKVSLVKDGDYYYFRPYAASKVICGSPSYPWYNIYTERLNVTTDRITCLPTYENTTTYATNMYVGTSGIFSRTTNTSSKTIKHDIRELQSADIAAERLYDVDVFQFKYNEDIITDKNDARYMKDLPGFIIEDLYEKYPIAVDKPSENVKDWSWNAQYLIPPMVKLLQDQHQEDIRMESDINELRAKYEQTIYILEQLYEKMAEQQMAV